MIPVLWIVLVFQLRFFGPKAEESGAQSVEADERHRAASTSALIVIVGTGLALWLAEAFAIGALAGEEDTAFMRTWIKGTFTVCGFLVFYIPVFPWFEALLERTPLEPYRQRWFGWLASWRQRRERHRDNA